MCAVLANPFLLNCVLAVKSVPDVGPASVMVGNIVQGNRLASAQGRDVRLADDEADTPKKVSIGGGTWNKTRWLRNDTGF